MESSHEELGRRYHDREKANAGGGCPLAVENAAQRLGKGHGGGLVSAQRRSRSRSSRSRWASSARRSRFSAAVSFGSAAAETEADGSSEAAYAVNDTMLPTRAVATNLLFILSSLSSCTLRLSRHLLSTTAFPKGPATGR